MQDLAGPCEVDAIVQMERASSGSSPVNTAGEQLVEFSFSARIASPSIAVCFKMLPRAYDFQEMSAELYLVTDMESKDGNCTNTWGTKRSAWT